MAKTASTYTCTECGWQTAKWVGRCPECQAWGTVVERGAPTGIQRRVSATPVAEGRGARPITDITTDAATHWPTGVGEFDRVLGGGIVPGSAILVSGEPGIGKSTMLLEVAARAARAKSRVLYVSAEESVGQVRLRAERTDALSDDLYLASETDLSAILGQIEQLSPDLLIVDSVQAVSSDTIDGLPGQPAQVREVSTALIRATKERSLPLLLVGHVTKDGSVAGPRLLEHLVDVVCHFDGDQHTTLRFIRALKNRFGSTDEVGCFEMSGGGIAEVTDPSSLFIGTSEHVPGTCVTVAMEGKRALPVEVQALVAPSAVSSPRRVTSGVDRNRVSMLLAILDSRLGVHLDDQDVYVSTVGGVRLSDPSADLAIAIALITAAANWSAPPTLCALGEVSLVGEVRPVVAAEQRRNEAKRLGYTTVIDAQYARVREALDATYEAFRRTPPAVPAADASRALWQSPKRDDESDRRPSCD